MKASVSDKEIKKFSYLMADQTQLDVRFEVYERSWKIGEVIHITPLECQGMAQSLAILGGKVLSEFEIEMNSLLESSKGNEIEL